MTKEEALKFIEGVLTDYLPSDDMDKKDEVVEALENEWIPVNKKLPNKNGNYLVTIAHNGNNYSTATDSFAKDLYEISSCDFYEYKDVKKSGWYRYDSEYGSYWEDTRVVAWMPLPELYKAESEDKE